jgi:CMP-N,N'-diacetyllegionaminic acid synthase
MLALIPARSGSVRVPNKNIYPLCNHPLIAYTIRAAINSNLFSHVFVCTDSNLYADIARYYGAEVPGLRPTNISGPCSPDRDWISWLFSIEPSLHESEFAFILRPTSPFRTSHTIIRAWSAFSSNFCDTLRAVKPVTEHPGKMWMRQAELIVPLLPFSNHDVPWHSNQKAALFDVFIQDASMEIFTISNFASTASITGSAILPFFANGLEGFDVNTKEDLEALKQIAVNSSHLLESILVDPWNFANEV